jgi:hypothetical protein
MELAPISWLLIRQYTLKVCLFLVAFIENQLELSEFLGRGFVTCFVTLDLARVTPVSDSAGS